MGDVLASSAPARPGGARRAIVVVIGAVVLTLGACSTGGDAGGERAGTSEADGTTTTTEAGDTPSPIADGVRIEVLSSQPDRVTGDEARIRVTPPQGVPATDLRVTLGDQEVTSQLDATDGMLEGVVRGFIEGNNTLTAQAGADEAVQRVRAWPRTGPVISGPHLPLLACSTEVHGLGPATDRDCSAPAVVSWRYVSTDGALREFRPGDATPADLATADVDDTEVPFYVRVETGVINRSVYQVASVDPTPGTDDPAGAAWNRRLLYRFGGDPACTGLYGQGTSDVAVADPAYLEQGYVVATATFNDWDVSCNDVLSAETAMMVSEHVVETFGDPELTIGEGTSAGALQVHLIAQNYPAVFDGAVASSGFPDAVTVASGATDCTLLLDHFDSAEGRTLDATQRAAIAGHASAQTCRTWADDFGGFADPTVGCDPSIAAGAVYDPTSNRGGVRCTWADGNRNQSLPDPETGQALAPIDNVGVQYGLDALNAGTIDVDAFLDVNATIGGFDADGGIVGDRTEADAEAVLRAYETGRVAMGGGDLLQMPIIDIDRYTDPSGDVHDRLRPFSLRDRLTAGADADAAPGFQIWTRPGSTQDLDAAREQAKDGGTDSVEAVAAVDAWLSAIATDGAGGTRAEKLARSRPDEAADNCIAAEGSGRTLTGSDLYEAAGPCRDDYPVAGDPRIAAGAPRSAQVLKCTLKPIDPTDYEVTFTRAQAERLRQVFAQGVCDWSSPSVGETVPASPDRTYADVETPAQNA